MIANRIEGTWLLESYKFVDANGEVLYPLGQSPTGDVLITRDGYLSLTFMAGDRVPFADDDIFCGKEEERAQAMLEYVAFGGPFELHNNAIAVRVTHSLFPNWIGTTQTRFFELDGDNLTLSTPSGIRFAGKERRGEARLVRARK